MGKFIETGSRLVVTSGYRGGRMESYCLIVTEFLFMVIEYLEIDSVDGDTTLNIINDTELYTKSGLNGKFDDI